LVYISVWAEGSSNILSGCSFHLPDHDHKLQQAIWQAPPDKNLRNMIADSPARFPDRETGTSGCLVSYLTNQTSGTRNKLITF